MYMFMKNWVLPIITFDKSKNTASVVLFFFLTKYVEIAMTYFTIYFKKSDISNFHKNIVLMILDRKYNLSSTKFEHTVPFIKDFTDTSIDIIVHKFYQVYQK